MKVTDEPVLRICGAAMTYRAGAHGWWKYDWLRRKFTRGKRA